MIIETYLDATDLTANQSLVILDGQGKRWNVNEALDTAAARAGVNTGSRRSGRAGGSRHEVILERWAVDLRYVSMTFKFLLSYFQLPKYSSYSFIDVLSTPPPERGFTRLLCGIKYDII